MKYSAIILFFYSFLLFSENEIYPPLQYGYQLEISGGLGTTYTDTFAQSFSINGDLDLFVIESFGIGFSDYIFYNDKALGNYFSVDILLRPLFLLRFVTNKFTKNYFEDYLYNTLTLRVGGVFQTFEVENISLKGMKFTVGIQMGFSSNILLSYSEKRDIFLKLNFMYHFLQSRTISNKRYDFDGFYFSIMLGYSFRFGKSVDWLIGENPNKPVKVDFIN